MRVAGPLIGVAVLGTALLLPAPAAWACGAMVSESGAAELDALRAARAGAPRGHWVRGHWKRQWYAATEEHRWHWIDGYPRGDFEKGAVPGDRVQVARPPRADVDEEGSGARK